MNQVCLKQIRLVNFKNYPGDRLNFDTKLNVIVGNNGMGKTNLLDAIYYLCMGKSAFSSPDSNVVKREESFFRLEGKFDCGANEEDIVVKVIPRKNKTLSRNHYTYQKLSEHIGLLPVVFIGPDDVYLVKGGSEERRKLIDNALCQKSQEYLGNLVQYNKLLKQRNALLKSMTPGRITSQENLLLSTLTEQLIPPGLEIHKFRQAFVQHFGVLVQDIYATLSNDHEKIEIEYRSSLMEQPFEQLLAQSKEKDKILQRTTCGIHRDDIVLKMDGHLVKKFGSQGQVKSFLLALKLAQYEWLKQQLQKKPILILDDLFDKLDANRVFQLIQMIAHENYGQVFISDTDLKRIESLIDRIPEKGIFYKIVEGSAKLL